MQCYNNKMGEEKRRSKLIHANISSTWKGLRSAWRMIRALMVFHLELKLSTRLLFWIAERRLGTRSGHKFSLTNSATAITRNCTEVKLRYISSLNKKMQQANTSDQYESSIHTASTKIFRIRDSTWSKAWISWSLNSLLTLEDARPLSMFRRVKFFRYVAAEIFRPWLSAPINMRQKPIQIKTGNDRVGNT